MKIKIYNAKLKKVENVEKIVKSLGEWEKILTPEQFEVTRRGGTEAPFSRTCPQPPTKEGLYVCVCCDTGLFSYSTKFESGTGWPSFFEPISELNIILKTDRSLGMVRTEVLCARCEAHLGHLFNDGPPPSGKRYCINSIALKLAEEYT